MGGEEVHPSFVSVYFHTCVWVFVVMLKKDFSKVSVKSKSLETRM
jgi:hypothetical protein